MIKLINNRDNSKGITMSSCPTCKSKTPVREAGYDACRDCGCEFNKDTVYTEGSYEKLCESVFREMKNNLDDAYIISSLKETVESFKNDGKQVLPNLVDVLTESADTLYNQWQSGRGNKYDFGVVLKGINRLLEWAEVHESDYPNWDIPQLGISQPADIPPATPDQMISQEPEQVNPETHPERPEGEAKEHDAMARVAAATEELKAAVADLTSAETQEHGGVNPIPSDNIFTSPADQFMQGLNQPIDTLGITPEVGQQGNLGFSTPVDATTVNSDSQIPVSDQGNPSYVTPENPNPQEEEEPIQETVLADHLGTATEQTEKKLAAENGEEVVNGTIPFTQNPSNGGNLASGKLNTDDQNKLKDADTKGKKVAVTAKKSAVDSSPDWNDAITESVLKPKDVIFINENFSDQWTVQSIKGSKATLRSGMKSAVIDVTQDQFKHVDGISSSWEREEATLNETKKLWEKMSKQIEEQEVEEKPTEDKAPEASVIEESDKNTIYKYIKESGIYQESRTAALQHLVSKFGNSVDQLSFILEEACMSETKPEIDAEYGVVEENKLEQQFTLENAWKKMSEKDDADKEIEDMKVEENLTSSGGGVDNKNSESSIGGGSSGLNAREKRGSDISLKI